MQNRLCLFQQLHAVGILVSLVLVSLMLLPVILYFFSYGKHLTLVLSQTNTYHKSFVAIQSKAELKLTATVDILSEKYNMHILLFYKYFQFYIH